ncbi:MAG: hypothetical protein PVH64_02735 [Bacillota bacterium]
MLNRMIQGIVASTVIGAAVGVVMLMRRRNRTGRMIGVSSASVASRTRGAIPMVRNNAKRWTSAVRNSTKAFTRKLSNV